MLKLINVLDSSAAFVQAFDFVLMLLCGIYCLRSRARRKSTGITLLAISCFVSAVILLGFLLSAAPNGHPLLPLTIQARQVFYLVARILAPFELLLFAIAIIFVAHQNKFP
jgi:hypothetical protein